MTRIAFIVAALFAFAVYGGDAPLKVCMLSASTEYKSDECCDSFQKYLEQNFNVVCTRATGVERGTDLKGLENLDGCDVVLLFTKRMTLPDDQLNKIKKYCENGRPIVGVRTASHAFQNWLEFDTQVLGGNYKNHYGKGPATETIFTDKGKAHPVLAGVKPFSSPNSLYRNTGHAADVELLMTGTAGDKTEPLTWTREYKGGRIFYTSLGGPEDFSNEDFKRMIAQALFWAAKRDVQKK
ncbi:MAG TPA: ThuA domain-containing protein [Planctomycetota bacterium]|nr:ThuA domain-containing protein [Planctomycetota bacterium]